MSVSKRVHRPAWAVAVALAVPCGSAGFTSVSFAAAPPPITFEEQRIEFEPGTDNAIREGIVDTANSDRWILRAAAGQVMDVTVDSADDNTVFAVFAPDRSVLATVSGDTFWSGTLPVTGDYSIEVASVEAGAFYRMKVWIGATLRDPLGLVQRMSFAPGASSGTASGAVVRGSEDWWLLGAAAGQTMQVDVTSLEANSTFDVLAPDGSLLTAPGERSTWTWQLPQSGDYRVVVRPTVGNATYTITVRITGGSSGPTPPQQAPPTVTNVRRISFAPGTDNLAVEDLISANEVHVWLADAAAGQILTVFLESDTGALSFNIFDPSGEPVTIDRQEAAIELGQSGDFEIEIVNRTGAVSAYRLTVYIT